VSNSPELILTDEEASGFLIAAQNVMRHYSVEATQKTLDWVALFGCVAGIYGPRAVKIKMRRDEEREAANYQAHGFPANVSTFGQR